MKLNWGAGIAIFLSLFITFILSLVVKAHQTKTELYAEDYYDQEVNYQSTIDAKQRGSIHINAFDVTINEDNNVAVGCPEWIVSTDNPTAIFYRPDNSDLDRSFEFTGMKNNQLVLDKSEFLSGHYEVEITWNQNDKKYLITKALDFKK